jgi:hypothetical protein
LQIWKNAAALGWETKQKTRFGQFLLHKWDLIGLRHPQTQGRFSKRYYSRKFTFVETGFEPRSSVPQKDGQHRHGKLYFLNYKVFYVHKSYHKINNVYVECLMSRRCGAVVISSYWGTEDPGSNPFRYEVFRVNISMLL